MTSQTFNTDNDLPGFIYTFMQSVLPLGFVVQNLFRTHRQIYILSFQKYVSRMLKTKIKTKNVID